jgi:endonuclease YncB( thermonuclease family)
MPDDAIDIKARSRVMNVLGDIWQLGLTRDRGRDAQNNKMPSIPFFEAARADLEATKADLVTLIQFVSDNASDLDVDFYTNKIEALQKQVTGFEETLSVPQLTVDEESAEEMVGEVTSVDDGDTIIVNGREIRLAGIDAPEKGTERGQAAKRYLENMVLGKTVTVKIDKYQGIEFYGRVLGVVFLNGVNVNIDLVKNCMAEPNTKFGRHNFLDPEEIKRAGEACGETYVGQGVVKVYSGKTNSEIYVDGVNTGKVTPAEINVPVGRHEFMCTTVGAAPDSKVINVRPGKVEIKLFPFSMPVATGIVEVESIPSGAEFVVDETPMGRTPTAVEVSSDGPHVIAFYLEGYSPDVVSIMAPAGKRVMVEATMEKES